MQLLFLCLNLITLEPPSTIPYRYIAFAALFYVLAVCIFFILSAHQSSYTTFIHFIAGKHLSASTSCDRFAQHAILPTHIHEDMAPIVQRNHDRPTNVCVCVCQSMGNSKMQRRVCVCKCAQRKANLKSDHSEICICVCHALVARQQFMAQQQQLHLQLAACADVVVERRHCKTG